MLDPSRLEPPPEGTVVSIGVFDGVHLGHQAILARNVERARELGAVPAVLTFRSHPKAVLLGRAPRAVTGLEQRLELFERAGIALTLALEFDEHLRDLEPERFAETYLRRALGARHLVLGFDSKFGRDRVGTPAWLSDRGWSVDVVPQVLLELRPVSSTAIREAVELGDLVAAGRMLGRPVTVMGTVVRGEALGRRLGFPTANLYLAGAVHPPEGVWAGFARVVGEGPPGPALPAVANIGRRPTVAGAAAPVQMEVHLLEGGQDLYGRGLSFEFQARLRGEQRFASLDALVEQIGRDCAQARAALLGRQPGAQVGSGADR